MATPVLMPRLGNTVESCLITGWLKQKGDRVMKGDILCELETDKAAFEIEAPADGILLDIFFDEDEDVPVLTTIAVIGEQGENYDALRPHEAMSNESAPATDSKPPAPDTYGAEVPEKNNTAPARSEDAPPSPISPRAKKLAEKRGIPWPSVIGTGPGGRIIERDIRAAEKNQARLMPAAQKLAEKEGTIPASGSGLGKRITASDMRSSGQQIATGSEEDTVRKVPLKGVRKIIAGRMLESLQNSAQLTLHSQADASNLLGLRKELKNRERPQNKITINDLLHFAVIKSLLINPELNSLFVPDTIEYYKDVHLGFAVDTPRGLLVPVIKKANYFNLSGLSDRAKILAASCIEGKINPDDLSGATFTVTNLGNFGIESFTPVLNLPQTAILGVGTINLKAVQADFGINYVPHIGFSLTIDHRIIDGATGARFLQTLAEEIDAIDLTAAL